MQDSIYDHYIAIDWSVKNMAIARMTKKSNKIRTIYVPSDVIELQTYLNNLRGTKILANKLPRRKRTGYSFIRVPIGDLHPA